MKSTTLGAALILVAAFLISGCDNLINLGGKKTSSKGALQVSSKGEYPSLPVKGPIVARVNNMPISLEDLNQEIETFNSMVPADRPEAKITTREQKLDYLKNQKVRQLLLYQAALDRGLDRQEDILRALEKTKQDLMVVDLVRQETAQVDVSSKDIEEYYNTYKEELREPEERQVREIVVRNESDAKDIVIQLMQGADFSAVARDRSIAPSAKDGGDLGFISPGAKFAKFDSVAFSGTLDVGKISNIFKGPDGYYVLKLEAKRGGEAKTLKELWDDIKKGLTFLKQQQKVEEIIGNLSRDAKIEVYESEVK